MTKLSENRFWWLWKCLLCGISAVLVATIALFLPYWHGCVVFSIGLVVLVCILFLNPVYWYRRAAWSLMTTLCAGSLLPGIRLVIAIPNGSSADFFLEHFHTNWILHFVIGFLCIILILCDFFQQKSRIIQEHTNDRYSEWTNKTGALPLDPNTLTEKSKLETHLANLEFAKDERLRSNHVHLIKSVTAVLLSVIVLMTSAYVLTKIFDNRSSNLDKIHDEHNVLRDAYIKLSLEGTKLHSSVLVYAEWIKVEDPGLRSIAEGLERRVEIFKQSTPKSAIDHESEKTLRLAEATSALVSGKPKVVRQFLGMGAEQHAVETLELLANSYFYEEDWKEAIPRFEAVLNLEEDNTTALHGLGLSYYYVNNIPKAIAAQDKLVSKLRNSTNRESLALGISISNRGWMRRINEVGAKSVIDDINEAAEIFASRQGSTNGEQATCNLAKTLINRAAYLVDYRERDKALNDLTQACSLLDTLEQTDPNTLLTRAEMLLMFGKAEQIHPSNTVKAKKYIASALEILDKVPTDAQSFAFFHSLFIAHFRRATINSEVERDIKQVLEDFADAESIADKMESRFPLASVEILRALLRNQRGLVYSRYNMFAKATSDFDFTIEKLKGFIEPILRPDLADEYSSALSNLAFVRINAALKDPTNFENFLNEAVDFASDAITQLSPPENKFPNDQDRVVLSRAFTNRGLAYFHKGNNQLALEDFNRAIEENLKLVEIGWSEFESKLIRSYINAALTFRKLDDHKNAVLLETKAIDRLDKQIKLPGASRKEQEQLATYYSYRMFDNTYAQSYLDAVADANEARLIRVELYDKYPESVTKMALAAASNDQASILATCPDVSIRNSTRAVELASTACELTVEKESSFLETLADAYAEVGKLKEAAETMAKSIEMTSNTVTDEVRNEMRKKLEALKRKVNEMR